MNLHYSQTNASCLAVPVSFDYHMNLHYSQTNSIHRVRFICLTII